MPLFGWRERAWKSKRGDGYVCGGKTISLKMSGIAGRITYDDGERRTVVSAESESAKSLAIWPDHTLKWATRDGEEIPITSLERDAIVSDIVACFAEHGTNVYVQPG